MTLVPRGALAYGIQLPIQSQSSRYAEPWELEAGPRELEAIARKADETGFLYVGVCDHVVIPRAMEAAMRPTWYDTVATLGYVAAVTRRVRLLSHVIVLAYRHPLVTAKSFMTLDALSRGRAILGVGAGHVAGEFEILGADFAARGRLADEALDAIREAFDKPAEVRGGAMAPAPVQSRLPIWVGGSSRPALRRAARRGDGWLPQGTPRDELPGQIAYLLEERRRAHGDRAIELGANAEPLYVGDPSWDVGAGALCGAPSFIAERLRALGELGVSHVQLRFRSRSLAEQLDQMDAFHSEVAPLLPR